MKISGLLFFLFCTSLFATEVIDSIPLSVEDTGTRKIVEENIPIGTLVPIKANINPEDGQLKLEQTREKAAKVEITIEEKREEKREERIVVEHVENSLEQYRYLQISYGFLSSKYEKVHSTLDNRSNTMSLKLGSDWGRHFQFGAGLEVIKDRSIEKIPNNIRAFSGVLFVESHAPLYRPWHNLEWLSGVSLSIGSYSTRRLSYNAQGQLQSTRLNAGTIFGIIPTLGIRGYFANRNCTFDFVAQYYHYFDKPQAYLGGFGFAPRLNFVF